MNGFNENLEDGQGNENQLEELTAAYERYSQAQVRCLLWIVGIICALGMLIFVPWK